MVRPCWSCGGQGHLKPNCPNRSGGTGYRRRNPAAESATVSSTLKTVGAIAGRQTKMLVDTVSGVTIMRDDVWKESQQICSSPLTQSSRPVVAANGQELDLLGQSDVLLQVGDLSEA